MATLVDDRTVSRLFGYMRRTFNLKLSDKTTKKDVDVMINKRMKILNNEIQKAQGLRPNIRTQNRLNKLKQERGSISKFVEGIFSKSNAWSRMKQKYGIKLHPSKAVSGKKYSKSYKKWTQSEVDWMKVNKNTKDIEHAFESTFGYRRSSSSLKTKLRRVPQPS